MAGFRELFPLLFVAVLGQLSLAFTTTTGPPRTYAGTSDTSYSRGPSTSYPWHMRASTYPWYGTTTGNAWGSRWPYGSTEDSSYNRRSSSPYPWNGVATTYPWYVSPTDRGTTSDWRYQTSTDNSYGCGTKYRNSVSGYITSPNYPGDYFNNAHCEYIIEPGTYVYLQVLDKVLERCCDHLVIYDRYGNDLSNKGYPYGNYFRVVFTSDGSAVLRGFKLYYGPDYPSFPTYPATDPWYVSTTDSGWGSRWPYASTEGTTSDWRTQTSPGYGCGETSYSTSGVFQSPNYPNKYVNNLHCVYRIYPSYNIELSIDYLRLEENYDFLRIVYTDRYGNKRTMSFTGSNRDTMVGSYFEITFTTDGSNTFQGFTLSWRGYGTWWGSTTSGYYQPSSPWWGWTSQAPAGNVMVTCDSRNFKVTVPRDMIQQVFPGSSPYDLTLDDPNCRGQVYYDVVMFRSNILGCGMTREETGFDMVYKNRIRTHVNGYYGTTATTGSIITRFNSKDISLECHLNRDVSIIGHFRPQHDYQLVARGSGNFSVHMDFYRDPSMNYRITSYPLYIDLNQDVYVDVGLESDDSDLKISLQNCVAKPSLDPYDYYNQYYLIRNGCPADQTVAFEYTSSLKHVHFRFRTFEFVRNNRDVYIFCYVRVCNGTDYEYRCRRECNSIHRSMRETSDDTTDHDLHIFQGPLAFREKRSADFQVAERTGGNDSNARATVPAVVMAIAAVAMVMAAVVMVITRKRRNRFLSKGVDTEL